MIALLHYALLKGWRDRSLPIFALIVPAQITAMLIGRAILTRQLQYPLEAVAIDDSDARVFSIVLPCFIASLSAFWTFRSEVATKAIGSFVIASRSINVVIALVSFAAATAISGLILASLIVLVLTASLPGDFATLAAQSIIFAFIGASVGALYVTISPQPAMFGAACIAGFLLAAWIFSATNRPQLVVILTLVPIASIAASTFLLRRRWVI